MPRVGFLTDMPSENEDPSPFPQLSGSQVPGFVPLPTPSLANRQFQSGKDQSATKQTAMAAAAVTAAVAATRAVTSHRSGDHDESFRANHSSPSPFEPFDLTEVEEDRAEDVDAQAPLVARAPKTPSQAEVEVQETAHYSYRV